MALPVRARGLIVARFCRNMVGSFTPSNRAGTIAGLKGRQRTGQWHGSQGRENTRRLAGVGRRSIGTLDTYARGACLSTDLTAPARTPTDGRYGRTSCGGSRTASATRASYGYTMSTRTGSTIASKTWHRSRRVSTYGSIARPASLPFGVRIAEPSKRSRPIGYDTLATFARTRATSHTPRLTPRATSSH